VANRGGNITPIHIIFLDFKYDFPHLCHATLCLNRSQR
jgi:hypothetical protein